VLADEGASPAPSQARLRRAVSTAYYALFHTVARAGALRFMGTGGDAQPGYTAIYRWFSHGRVKSVCQALAAAPGGSVRRQPGAAATSADMRYFADVFRESQDQRNRADYDPRAVFLHADTVLFVDEAERAMEAFARATAEEQADVLALMLVNNRV
jgi:hypothetical protein